ncbi:hypothetical protein BTL_4102 [Burkholderia thailandensis H0587]|nr:hypothetical protein BTL_4102 [Burkholderia thailandensis H0587]AOJ53893.1 hypothetical protein AQ475_24120 [Burkholderia thailandensis]AVR27969.1 hypothetical protein A8H32_23680 [Burkholderia thailandensis]
MKKFDVGNGWDPIITTLHQEFQPAIFDAELVECLDIGHADSPREFRHSAPRFVIGIRNETGDLYRRVGAYSTGDIISLRNWFLDNGFTDEIGMARIVVEGCDHVFRRHA